MIFVEREKALELIRAFLQQVMPNQQSSRQAPWLMILMGQECIGKSDILSQIKEEHRAGQDKLIYLDFADPSLHDHFTILDNIKEKIAPSCDKQAVEKFEQELQMSRAQINKAELHIGSIKQVINADRDAHIESNTLMISLDEIKKTIKRPLIDSLKTTFKKVICTLQGNNLIILLDNFERLSERDNEAKKDLAVDYWFMNALLPDIHNDLTQQRPEKRCLAVMTSRMKPPLDVIRPEQQWSINLLPLNKNTMTTYLQQRGITEEALHNLVFAKTDGHAYCVTIFHDTIKEHEQDANGSSLDYAYLTALFYKNAWQVFVQEKVLARLCPPFNELLRYGVITENFTQHMWCTIFQEFLSKAQGRDHFENFIRYPCIQFQPKENCYTIHPLLRRIILTHLENEEEDELKKYSERAAYYKSGRTQSS